MADMVKRMIPYLDKHLALGLLSFLADRDVDVTEAMTHVLQSTALTLEGTVKPEHEARIAATTERAAPALNEFFRDAADPNYTYQFKLSGTEVEQLRAQSEMSYEYLKDKCGITEAVMQAVMELAYLYYDKAAYGDAAELLSLCNCVSGYDLPKENILWGKLMCDTGACNWQSAMDIAQVIRKNQNSDDDEIFSQVSATTVRQRAYLLHWVLFPIFKGGRQYPVQLLYYIFDNRSDHVYQKVVETVCPHYLRYVGAAALLNSTRSANFRETAKMAVDVCHEYSDALTELILKIHKSAFNDALRLLPEVRQLIRDDYFLQDFEEELLEKAKRMIFYRYITVHTVVSIPFVAEKLDVDTSEAEVWLANLVSESKQRAKVDSVKEQLNVEPLTRSVDTTVFDKLDSANRK